MRTNQKRCKLLEYTKIGSIFQKEMPLIMKNNESRQTDRQTDGVKNGVEIKNEKKKKETKKAKRKINKLATLLSKT